MPLRPAVPPAPAMAGNQQPRLLAAGYAGRHALGDAPQGRNVGRVVLAVAVERRDPASARGLDATADRGALAIAARVADQTQQRQGGLQPANLDDGRIVAAV